MVSQDHTWTGAACALAIVYTLVSLILTRTLIIGRGWRGFRARLRDRARRCLDRSGYVGAVMGRHTLLVTMNVLALNLSLGLLSAIRAVDDPSAMLALLRTGLGIVAAICVGQVVVIAAVTLALCNEVIRLAEETP